MTTFSGTACPFFSTGWGWRWGCSQRTGLTFSAWASSDFRLLVTVFNSSSSSEHLLFVFFFCFFCDKTRKIAKENKNKSEGGGKEGSMDGQTQRKIKEIPEGEREREREKKKKKNYKYLNGKENPSTSKVPQQSRNVTHKDSKNVVSPVSAYRVHLNLYARKELFLHSLAHVRGRKESNRRE